MDYYPTQIQRPNDQTIRIVWSDQQVMDYSVHRLRQHCPCATCREKHGAATPPATALPVLSIAETQPLHVASMKPVGNYAYAIYFSDGHKNGIYTYELLRGIGTPIDAQRSG